MDKETFKYITQNITPEEAAYVTGIRSTIDDTEADVDSDRCEDIIFITKLLAFEAKFKTITWDKEDQYRYKIQDFTWQLTDYKDRICENIQSIIGVIQGSDITKIELPVSNNPLELINELKICVNNWFLLHKDNIEYEGCRSITSNFIAVIHKNIYLFRLTKVSSPNYCGETELPPVEYKDEDRPTCQPTCVPAIQF